MSVAPTVVVGMSGGVDSSVSALLLKKQGYRVIGMYMKNWEEIDENGVCTSVQDYEDVVRVCQKIDIPYYSVNFVKEYQELVFAHFLKEFQAGHTPNPDILCNREIKFNVLLEKAIEIGGDFLATGHYCQKQVIEGNPYLIRGRDPSKDQSYFLYAMPYKALDKVLFPIGNLLKSEVRAIARAENLATSEKKDSTGVCFIGERNFKQFLSNYIAAKPGQFQDLEGKVLGQHDGVAYYTVGQRKGLGIGGPGEAWFVVDKDIENNVVILAQGAEHPALYCDDLIADDVRWLIPEPIQFPLKCTAKIRYRQPDDSCVITPLDDGRLHVTFAKPQRAVTLQQSIVFYQGECCLGGGIISSAGISDYHREKNKIS